MTHLTSIFETGVAFGDGKVQERSCGERCVVVCACLSKGETFAHWIAPVSQHTQQKLPGNLTRLLVSLGPARTASGMLCVTETFVDSLETACALWVLT